MMCGAAHVGARPPAVRPHAPEKEWSMTCAQSEGGGACGAAARLSRERHMSRKVHFTSAIVAM
jgi:hypothetical protein